MAGTHTNFFRLIHSAASAAGQGGRGAIVPSPRQPDLARGGGA